MFYVFSHLFLELDSDGLNSTLFVLLSCSFQFIVHHNIFPVYVDANISTVSTGFILS